MKLPPISKVTFSLNVIFLFNFVICNFKSMESTSEKRGKILLLNMLEMNRTLIGNFIPSTRNYSNTGLKWKALRTE